MQVIRAKTAGFCFGVSHALTLLDKQIETLAALQANGTPAPRLITLGPIIHNPLVMEAYAQKGVVCLETVESIQPNDHVVIRAHGIPIATEEHLRSIGAVIIDATCPKVKKAQNAIAQHQTTYGGTLLLFGEVYHPEVQGLLSYANPDAIVFESLEELQKIPLAPHAQYFLAAQTTQDKAVLQQIITYLTQQLQTELPVLETICTATHNRQDEVMSLATQVSAMVVVGGLNSGNTKRLAEIAAAHNIPTTHIEKIEDINPSFLQNVTTVGLTAGASTPNQHIDAAQTFLENL